MVLFLDYIYMYMYMVLFLDYIYMYMYMVLFLDYIYMYMYMVLFLDYIYTVGTRYSGTHFSAPSNNPNTYTAKKIIIGNTRDTGMKYKKGFFFKTLRSEVMASFTHLE